MSPHNVNNFVSDLVMMAQAMERVPQLEKEITRQENVIIDKDNIITMIQLDLEQARSYSAKLEAKVHDLEVAKDQAETMFLESDDRASKAAKLLADIERDISSFRAAMTPEPTPTSEPIAPIAHSEPDTTQGQSEGPLPLADTNSTITTNSAPVETSSETATHTEHTASMDAGQSDPLPSPAPSPAEPNASTPSADGLDDAKSSTDDVGYHNEPQWHEYGHSEWQERMDRKYGMGNWPRRVENNFYRS